jgi:hypothetical protein
VKRTPSSKCFATIQYIPFPCSNGKSTVDALALLTRQGSARLYAGNAPLKRQSLLQ